MDALNKTLTQNAQNAKPQEFYTTELAQFVLLNSLDAQLALMDQSLLKENALGAMLPDFTTVDQPQLLLALHAQLTAKHAQLLDAQLAVPTLSIQPLPPRFLAQFVMLTQLDAQMP